jgi:hypothetical protein
MWWHGQHEHVLAVREPRQGRAQQRAAPDVEGRERRLGRAARHLRGGGRRVEAGQVDLDESAGQRRRDDAARVALLVHREARAQHLVPLEHRREGRAQGGRVERALQAARGVHVGRGRARLELLEEPEALLPEGERGRAAVGDAA